MHLSIYAHKHAHTHIYIRMAPKIPRTVCVANSIISQKKCRKRRARHERTAQCGARLLPTTVHPNLIVFKTQRFKPRATPPRPRAPFCPCTRQGVVACVFLHIQTYMENYFY